MSSPSIDIDAVLKSALRSFEKGEMLEARSHLQQVLASAPDNFDALHLIGIVEHKLGRLQQAEEYFKRALSINPDFEYAHYNFGRALQDHGKLEEAALAYEKAAALNPNLDFAHFNQGLIYLKLEDFSKAVAAFQRALAIHPDDPDYHFNIGNAFKGLPDLPSAVDAYCAAIDLAPNKPEPYINLGIAFKALGRQDQAIAAYQQCIKILPDFADAYFNLGNVYEEIGDLQNALSAYQSAIDRNPAFAKAYNNLGNVYHEMGNPDQALTAYKRSLELDASGSSASHMVNALTGNTPDTAPVQYATILFDKAAKTFEDRLVNDLKYNSPQELRDDLAKIISADFRFESALDLGCGTGLSGAPFRPIVKRMTGVDVSAKMIEKAKVKNIYDALTVADVHEFLAQSREKTYDLFIAADVLVYIGRLEPLFEGIRACAKQNAYFLFAIESIDEGTYCLRKTGRFAQSKKYIERLAEAYHFSALSCRPTTVRMENDLPIRGLNYILRGL
jgi:predicted TPR repeat methyltransferase